MKELTNTCKAIRKELEALYNLTSEEREELGERGEISSAWEWINDALDIEYTISSRGDYLGARVYVCLGGPTVWIDTRNHEIRGAWGPERAEIWLPSEICDELDEYLEECYRCLK